MAGLQVILTENLLSTHAHHSSSFTLGLCVILIEYLLYVLTYVCMYVCVNVFILVIMYCTQTVTHYPCLSFFLTLSTLQNEILLPCFNQPQARQVNGYRPLRTLWSGALF